MVFPLKKDQIRIHYIGYHSKHNIPIRYQKIYKLEEKESNKVCKQIADAILQYTQNTASDNSRLFLFPEEKIIKSIRSTTRNFEGTFYITNLGLYLEDDDKGLAFEMPYTMYHSQDIHNKTIKIKYNEMHEDGSIKVHEFKIRPDDNSKQIFDCIETRYRSSNASAKHDFESLQQMFENLNGNELRQILFAKSLENQQPVGFNPSWGKLLLQTNIQSENLQKYIGRLADKKWGESRPKVKWCYCSIWFQKDTLFGKSGNDLAGFHINGNNRNKILENPEKFYTQFNDKEWNLHADYHFRMYEMMLVKAALFADVSLDVIGDHSSEYNDMIAQYQQDFDEHRDAEMNLAKWNDRF